MVEPSRPASTDARQDEDGHTLTEVSVPEPILSHMATKTRPSFRCTNCSASSPKWAGRCTQCQSWGTVEEVAAEASKSVGLKSSMKAANVTRSAQRVGDIRTDRAKHATSGIGEFDRVLGGGYVAGGVILLAGEPGAGKSTLLIEAASKAAETGRTVLYISGEESAEQIKLRADRVGATATDLFITSESDLSVILGHIEEVDPGLLIVDSVQTIASPDVEGRMGGVTQVVEVASVISRVAKERGIPTVLVGHVTKNAEIGGPRTLEHLVDTVCMLEGDKQSTLRLLRGIKNRYGAADEIGCFMHTADGLEEVPDPSGLFLGARSEPVAGTCVTVVVEGKRPLVAEVQALVATSHLPVPRRGASGLDSARLAMTQAVVERHGKVRLYDKDVFCATVGGMKIAEPSADLSLALAIASAASDQPLPADTIALGEVALSGDIRPVHDIERRLVEASRMGFKVAIVPAGSADRVSGTKKSTSGGRITVGAMTLVEVESVARAVSVLTRS